MRSLLKSERTTPPDRRFMTNSLEIAPTSPNYVCALTDSLKAPYPTTLACLIPPSLPSWWLLCCPHLWCGYWISLLFASAYFLLLIYCIIFVFVCMTQFGPWAAMLCYYKIISYHIISYHIISYHIISYHIISYHYHIISYNKRGVKTIVIKFASSCSFHIGTMINIFNTIGV